MRAPFLPLGLAAAAMVLVACSGGGSSSSRTAGVTSDIAEEEHVVVQYDEDQDGNLDVLTLDPAAEPLAIVAGLRGTDLGDLVEAPELEGKAVDGAIADALRDYLASSLELDAQTELEVTDSLGRQLTIVVFE